MALNITLETGAKVKTWNYDTGTMLGQSLAVKNNSTGEYEPLVHVESVKCAEGIKNRLIVKKTIAEKHGFIIIEE